MSVNKQKSILGWASMMLNEDVDSLLKIQEVYFLKKLLFQCDQSFFAKYKNGRSSDNYPQVLQQIALFFKTQLNTDISEDIKRINVYKNCKQVWDLAICIAIKGPSRSLNINKIFEMDERAQAELMGVVTEIIQKYKQSTMIMSQDNNNNNILEDDNIEMLQLLQQNEQLILRLQRTEQDLARVEMELKNAYSSKADAQHQTEMLRMQKLAFIQSMTTIYRNGDEGDSQIHASGSLADISTDIISFIRSQKRRLIQQQQKSSNLQWDLRETKINIQKLAEQNYSFVQQLVNLGQYQTQIQSMREQINKVFNQNSELYDKISDLEEQKSRLIKQLRVNQAKFYSQNKQKQKMMKKQINIHQQEIRQYKNDSPMSYLPQKLNLYQSKQDKKAVADQLYEPLQKSKRQRQLQHLKKQNKNLKLQIVNLKKNIQSIQGNAKQFIQNNQQITQRWQQDYQQLASFILQLTRPKSQYIKQQQHQIQNTQQQPQNQKQKQKIKKNFTQQQYQIQINNNNNIEIPQLLIPQSDSEQDQNLQTNIQNIASRITSRNTQPNWDQLVQKIHQVICRAQEQQIYYQNIINSLSQQNKTLVKMLDASKQRSSIISQANKQQQQKKMKFMSYIQLQQGQDMDENYVNKLRGQKSMFYQGGSKIIQQIIEKPFAFTSQVQKQDYNKAIISLNNETFQNINELRSQLSKANFQGNKQLEQQFKRQIQRLRQQYSRLNENYQLIFNQLNLYQQQQQNNQKQNRPQLRKLLNSIKAAQNNIIQQQQTEMIKLSTINSQLRQALICTNQQKKIIRAKLKQLNQKIKQSKKQVVANTLEDIHNLIYDLQNKISQKLHDPLVFVSTSIQSKDQQLAFYQLYLTQKQKALQLNQQVQLLSSVLLQYRNMIQFN